MATGKHAERPHRPTPSPLRPSAEGHLPKGSVHPPSLTSMESSFMATRKHDDSCGRGVPALKSVGVEWVKQRWDIRWYIWARGGRHGEEMPQ